MHRKKGKMRLSGTLLLTAAMASSCCALLCSCGIYVPVATGADIASAELPEGAHIRIHTIDGRTIDDILVRVTDGELECRATKTPFKKP